MSLFSRIINYFRKLEPRIYRGSTQEGYFAWKEQTFGRQKCVDLHFQNCLEGKVWELHNVEVEEWHQDHYKRMPQKIYKLEYEKPREPIFSMAENYIG